MSISWEVMRVARSSTRRWAAGAVALALAVGLVPMAASSAHAVDTIGADVDEATDTLVSSDAARTAPTVTLPVQTVASPGRGGLNGVTTVRVGNSKPMKVIIDTGFSGLLLFPGAWEKIPGAVKMSTSRSSVVGPDGSRIPGLVGKAPFTFGGVTTAMPIPFIYSNAPSAYARMWEREGVFGLMGVGTKGGSMVNPFTALPGNLGLRWSMHFDRPIGGKGGRNGEVVLGADLPTDPVMTFQLPSNGQSTIGGLLWNDEKAQGCWKFGTLREVCGSTMFDAAFNIMRVKGSAFSRIPHDRQGWVRKGTRASLAASGSAFTGSSFVVGDSASRNKVKYLGRGPTYVNTGNQYFFDYTISYDTVTGRLSVSDPVGKAGVQQ